MYDTVELSDCSGIFHRVLQAMVAQCANLSPPKPSQFRDTRDLARFYHQKGQLVLIQDALEQAQLIKPGAVLFYGYAGVRYQDFSAEDLFARGNGIEHMGVVVSVTRDSEGRVVSYRLFHGRSTGKIAAVTSYHLRRPTRSDLPPLGNWDQQWVAFAPLFGS